MDIANKLVTVAENVDKVYEAGYNKAESVNPLPYINIIDFQWHKVAFPEGFDFVLKLRDKPATMNAMLSNATGLNSVTLICAAEGTVSYAQLIRASTTKTLDISQFKPKPKDLSHFALDAKKLVTISGALDLSNCTKTTIPFDGAFALENIEFAPNTIPISIKFGECRKLTHDSLMSIINGLAVVETTQTLTLPSSLKILQSQVDSANAKGWTVAGGKVVSEEEYYE